MTTRDDSTRTAVVDDDVEWRPIERNFIAQLDACGPVVVIDGTEVGPYPIERGKQ